MTISVSLYPYTPTKKEKQYPWIGAHKGTSPVVVFHKSRAGMTISNNDTFYPFGRYCETWQEEEFTPYVGSINIISKD